MYLTVNSIIRQKDSGFGGLIGGFFRFAAGGQIYGITCKHVIASNNYNVGDVLTDETNHHVGTLSHWLILESEIENRAEFALFKPNADFEIVWTQKDPAFKPVSFATAALNSTVDFVNADVTTHGVITDVKHKVVISWDNLDYTFSCIQVQSMPGQQFSKPGHSGGAVYIGKYLLGIILGVSTDGTKTYIVPYLNGILSVVDLKLF